jgi:hypothetical protein
MTELLSGVLDRKKIHVHLHSMASMAGNMGFARMESECRRMMDAMAGLSDADLNGQIRTLHELYKQGCGAFEQIHG